MNDNELVANVRAAIDKTEKIAAAAVPGSWTVRNHHEILTDAAVPDALIVAIGDSGGGVVTTSTAEHIALHDPVTVLRRCATDRETVNEYALTCRLRDERAARLREQGQLKDPRDLEWWSSAAQETDILRTVIERMARNYCATEEAVDG